MVLNVRALKLTLPASPSVILPPLLAVRTASPATFSVVEARFPMEMDEPVSCSAPETFTCAPTSDTAPLEVRFRVPAELAPDRAVSESSFTLTEPVVTTAREPKLAEPVLAMVILPPLLPVSDMCPPTESVSLAFVPKVKELALTVAAPETFSWADPPAVATAPADVRDRLPAELEPCSPVAESSLMVTAPVVANVREPKLTEPAPPTLMDPPLRAVSERLSVTLRTSPLAGCREMALPVI